MNRRVSALAIVAVAMLTGCPSFTFVRSAVPPHTLKPRRASEVEVLKQPPSRDYVGVGMIDLDQTFATAPNPVPPWMVEKFRIEAAKIGCDAIVIEETRSPTASAACLVYR